MVDMYQVLTVMQKISKCADKAATVRKLAHEILTAAGWDVAVDKPKPILSPVLRGVPEHERFMCVVQQWVTLDAHNVEYLSRWVIDRRRGELIAAEYRYGSLSGWQAMDTARWLDLCEHLRDNRDLLLVRPEASDVYCCSRKQLPAWTKKARTPWA